MKISVKSLIICLILAVVLSGISLLKASAQDNAVTDQQINQIRNNCLSVKNTLNQLHVSDALLRVNRGQLYESMATKLMERFNARVAINSLNNNDLSSVTTTYKSTLDTFRLDYKTYEEQMSLTINMDCYNQPVAFYDAILLVRTMRNQVHADVIKLNQYIDQYQSTINQFEENYQSVISGAKQ